MAAHRRPCVYAVVKTVYGDSSGVAYGTWNVFTADVFGGDERTREIVEDPNNREIGEFRMEIMRDPCDSNSWVPVLCVGIRM